jgi:hypothetical protein
MCRAPRHHLQEPEKPGSRAGDPPWTLSPPAMPEVAPAEPERRPSRRPFHELPNVLITPHSSSSSEATVDRRWSVVAANLDRFARGEKLENIVLQT